MNARFWVYINDDWVKLTIRPGKELHHHAGGQTEEGFEAESNRWIFDGRGVLSECTGWGRDCDGRYENRTDAGCLLKDLRSRRRLDEMARDFMLDIKAEACRDSEDFTAAFVRGYLLDLVAQYEPFLHGDYSPPGGDGTPRWKEVSSRQRDHFAEAMGY